MDAPLPACRGDKYVSGTRFVASLRFLDALKKSLNEEYIPESAAILIWPSFLSGDAEEVFNQYTEDGDGDVGLYLYPGSGNFLLRTYGYKRYLESAVECIDNMQQS